MVIHVLIFAAGILSTLVAIFLASLSRILREAKRLRAEEMIRRADIMDACDALSARLAEDDDTEIP